MSLLASKKHQSSLGYEIRYMGPILRKQDFLWWSIKVSTAEQRMGACSVHRKSENHSPHPGGWCRCAPMHVPTAGAGGSAVPSFLCSQLVYFEFWTEAVF